MTIQSSEFPRVTYTNTAINMEPLHAMLDRELPRFRAALGQRYFNLIGGAEDSEGDPYEVRSPLDDRLVLGTFIEPSEAAVTRAVAAARVGFETWRALGWQRRVEMMRAFARELDRRKYELAMAALYEVGKTRIEALGETEEAVALIDHYCDQMESREGFIEAPVVSGTGETARTLLKPFGVFAVIAPFNYPVALVANMAGAALVAGNTVVLKASPNSGLTATLFARAAAAAGLPAGVLNLLFGGKAGPALVDSEGVDGVAFTGSYRAGMDILRKMAAGGFMRPVLGELGGKNAVYVTSSADLEVAVEGTARSAFAMQGQKCSACSVAFVHSSLYEPFLEALAARAKQFKAGNTAVRAVSAGPLVNAAALARYEEAVAHGKTNGRLVFGGERYRGGDFDHGCFVEPAILADLPASDPLFTRELFVPLVAVRRFDDLGEALAMGNAVPFGLTAGLYCRDPAEISYFKDHVEAGVLYINRRTGATTGAWPGIQSFCGWKGSGLTGKGGLGPHYLPQFLREQSVTTLAD